VFLKEAAPLTLLYSAQLVPTVADEALAGRKRRRWWRPWRKGWPTESGKRQRLSNL